MVVYDEWQINRMPDKAIRMELISYFNHHPDTMGSPQELSQLLDRDHNQVERQLENLVRLHILEKLGRNGSPLYRYIPALSIALVGRRTWDHDRGSIALPHADESPEAEEPRLPRAGQEASEHWGASVRLKLIIVALRENNWRECLKSLLDIISHSEDIPCAAYHLGERCSQLLWDCQRGSHDVKVGMSRVAGIQNMVIEGELIENKGMLDNGRQIKFLYPMEGDEDILICMERNGKYDVDTGFIGSLLVDILPVIAGKRRMEIEAERAAADALQAPAPICGVEAERTLPQRSMDAAATSKTAC